MTPTLIKNSPLSGIYSQYGAHLTAVAEWRIAAHFGDPQRERQQVQTGAVLADWSHIGKISLVGKEAGAIAHHLCPGAEAIPPLSSLASLDRVVLRLTPNDYLILCLPGLESKFLQQIGVFASQFPRGVIALNGVPAEQRVAVTNQTGALGCFALGGVRRDQVLERSTALDLRRDRVPAGSVVQSSVHMIRCTLYRTAGLEILLHSRNLSESLFEALVDVGIGVGLLPAGIEAVPVRFGDPAADVTAIGAM